MCMSNLWAQGFVMLGCICFGAYVPLFNGHITFATSLNILQKLQNILAVQQSYENNQSRNTAYDIIYLMI